MATQFMESAPPLHRSETDRRRGRGWQLSLACLGFTSLIAGVYSGALAFGGIVWISTGRTAPAVGQFALALLSLSIPALTFALGAWTWRTNRVRRHASGYAMATGVAAVGIVIILVAAAAVPMLLLR